jgi:hypothetical protein
VVRYLTNDYKFNDIDTTQILNKLRSKYNNLAIFDDGDRACIDFPQALPIVDAYFVSQLYSNLENYKRPIQRGQIHSEFYAKKGVKDGNYFSSIPLSSQDISKIHLAWNIGAGCYPRNNLLRKIGLVAARVISPKIVSLFYNDPSDFTPPKNGQMYNVQARFSSLSVSSTGYQRELILNKAKKHNKILTGYVNSKKYNKEIKNSKIVLSPFGWGEVCFRDFEAVLNGAMLMKPDMSHIKTWPDIYHPYRTYVPIRWDGDDLYEKVNEYLLDDVKRQEIANNAFRVYKDALKQLNSKVVTMGNIIFGR